MKPIKSITICTSASFYKEAWEIKERLEKMGIKVWVPYTAKIMHQTKNYKVADYKTWYKDAKKFSRKAYLMKKHFDEIKKADAILVVNLKKKGVEGYVGGNVLMEMGLAFYLKKPIFVWRKIAKTNPFYEELLGMLPDFLNGDLALIQKYQ